MPEIFVNPKELSEIVGAKELVDSYGTYKILDYQGFINEFYSMGVALQEDPGNMPLSELNLRIAHVDAQKSRAAAIVSSAILNESELEVLLYKARTLYKREFDLILPQEPVRSLPNKESREAACNIILQQLKELVDAIQGSVMQAKTFTKIANLTLEKLDSTNKNVSRQITVLQHQLELGEIQRQAPGNPHTFKT